jgi:chromosome segregation ATPase
LRLSNNLKDVEGHNEKLKIEISNTTSNHGREIKSKDRRIDELERYVREKDIELKRVIESLDNVSIQKDKLYDDNNRMFSELEYLRVQVNKLTSTNNMVFIVYIAHE